MSSAHTDSPVPVGQVARHWSAHLLSFAAPVIGLSFVASGPHRWWVALLFLVPGAIFEYLDVHSPDEVRQPPEPMPTWPFDGMLYLLFTMQVATIVLAAHLIAQVGLFSIDTLVLLAVVPGSSAFGIITAHELIHRREKHFQLMGRIMMGLVLYEHFYTEHVRGHHARVGTAEDPATARYGERFWPFFRRTVPGQLRSAWRIETLRLGDVDMAVFDPRILRSRVLHGLVAEWAFAFLILGLFGGAAFLIHLIQAVGAFTGLEVVNYFEHWGLARTGRRVRPVDSWDTSNRFTLFGLVGLSRHADHHANATRPFQYLRHHEESPKLPRGYPGMVRLVLADNRKFQRQMTEELERRGLGPFRVGEGAAG
jgi:alkane 1-monooxygenase